MSPAIKRIAVIGPESTGKSTLSEALATALQTVWVREYAREYLQQTDRPYTEADLTIIAQGQAANEDLLATEANGLLICDTTLHVVKVWSEHKYGRCSDYINQEISRRKYDLFLLTGIDMVWQPDPLREHPDPEMRQHFYNIYHDIVAQSGAPWIAVNGNEQQRLEKALAAIRGLALQAMAFPAV